MQFTYESIVAALESAQGGTFYALLVLLLLSVASLILQARARPAKLDPRVSLGLGILMGLRLVEVLVFAWAWLGTASVAAIGAPLERGIHLVTLVTLGWIWSRSDGEGRFRQGLFGTALVAALVIASSLIAIWLNAPIRATFNYTNFDYIWTSASLFALILGFSQLLSAAKPARGLGFFSLGLLFVGQLVHLFLAEPFGSMPLAAQAAYLLSLPLLFLLPVSSRKEMEVGEVTEDATSQSRAPTSPAPDAGLPSFFDFDAVEGTPSPKGSPEELARETAEKFGADLCVLVRLVGDELQLVYGYNLLRSTSIETGSLPALEVPTLVSAIRIGQPLRLSAEERLPDLTSLSKILSLSFTSHLLAVPFSPSSGTREWAMLLLDLEHEWQLEDEVALEIEINQLNGDLAQMLGSSELAESISQPASGIKTAHPDLEELEAENARYRQDIDQLIAHIDQLKFSQPTSNGQAAVQSNEVVQALQMENERLKNSLASLEANTTLPSQPSSLEAKQAKEELRLALEEVASLHIRLDAAQQGVLEAGVGAPTTKKMAASQTELIASIAQELRQPLSSILGYTDLLLGESVGILGALQRKFLERVRNSTERMNTLIDNLIRIAELDQGGYSATRKAVDLSAVMDDAIGQLRTQLQEKRIALRVDLPPQLPEINTDRDALQQILYHLLQNADAATPAEGSITLRAFMDSQSELGEFVLIQVSDTGGGIPEEDLPRVFSRVYRASNPVIPGVGDTGVGLTIAETLTQALGGRIWVESEAGVGATFSVLLPLQPAS